MIRHQSVGENIAAWRNILSYFPKKVYIVVIIEEDKLLIIPPVINMIDVTGNEIHR
jgi:hypothetical protein